MTLGEVAVLAAFPLGSCSHRSEAEVRWLNQFAMHLFTEFSVMKAEDEELVAPDPSV